MTKSEAKNIIGALIDKKQGEFPKAEEISEALNIKRYQVPSVLNQLIEDGWLVRTSNNWYKIRSENDPVTPTVRGTVAKTVPIEPLHLPESDAPPAPDSSPECIDPQLEYSASLETDISDFAAPSYAKQILRIMMAFVGVGAMVNSAYFTATWLTQSLPDPLAWLLSLIMVGFAVSAFETVVLFHAEKLGGPLTRIFITLGFGGLWATVVFFSITSVVAGQYTEWVDAQTAALASTESIAGAKTRYDHLRERQRLLKDRLEWKKAGAANLYSQAARTNQAEAPMAHANLAWLSKQADAEVATISDELNKINEEEAQLLQKYPALASTKNGAYPDFYGWLAEVFKTDPALTQFFISLAPALFVDLIAPAAIAIALFLQTKK